MTTEELEDWQFDDPATVLEKKRGEQCAGCVHAVKRVDEKGLPKMVCRTGKRYGSRCAKYKETS